MDRSLFRARMPAALKEALLRDAKANDRSMNAELVQILKAHFGKSNGQEAVGTK